MRMSEFALRIGNIPQIFANKLDRDVVTYYEMLEIAVALRVYYEQVSILENGDKIQIGSTEFS